MKLRYDVVVIFNNGEWVSKTYSSLFFARAKVNRMNKRKDVDKVQLVSRLK